jgi:hypothetical protein
MRIPEGAYGGIWGSVYIPSLSPHLGGDSWMEEDDRDVYKLVVVREDWDYWDADTRRGTKVVFVVVFIYPLLAPI